MPTATRVCASLAVLGLVVAVAGTFLPWFHSGEMERGSYEAAALLAHFDLVRNAFAGAALRGWVAMPLLAAGCVALYALRLPRTAAAATTVLSILVGTVAVLTLVQGGGEGATGAVGVSATGPLTTTTGMILALLGALGVLGTLSRAGATTGRAGVRP
ncbi:hypothetical protein [Qaidamihabitans albus]|uniref:hypothetical protein n=1 Tax=Qaidamihabitans albus TaxID=2795733 RepID=UPI0018F1ADC1|nr:hypothetical protein [Qaidamihabitans albus]